MIDLYFQPYGDEQQLNLNWIISEIIALHKQLDPDYETPSFEQIYPYSNLNRLNLDWVLSELKALKELAPEPTPTIDIQAVAEALVALPFDSTKSYQIYDYISRDGEIWRAKEAIAAGGVWDSTKWFKTKLGTDLAVLERWINTINNSLSGEIEARQNADTTLQTNINNEALARQQADTALQNGIDLINAKAKYDVYDEGIYTYNNPILAAYITGSGNYIDFFMPIKVNPDLNISVTYYQSYRHEGDTGDSHTKAFLLDSSIDATVGMNANIEIVKRSESGLTFEIGFTNTQTRDKPATIVIARLVITATY